MLGSRCFNCSHIQREIRPAPHRNRLSRVDGGIESVHPKGGRAIDDLVTRIEKQTHYQVNQFVCARAREDGLGRHTGIIGERRAQLAVLRVGINVREGQIGKGSAHTWGRPVWILVGVQLDDLIRPAPEPLREHLEWKYGRIRLQSGYVASHSGLTVRFQFPHFTTPSLQSVVSPPLRARQAARRSPAALRPGSFGRLSHHPAAPRS